MAVDYNQLISSLGNARAIEIPVQQVIDELWVMAQSVALDDAAAYRTLRQAIAWLEVARHA